MDKTQTFQTKIDFIGWKKSHITGGFWQKYQQLFLRVTLPIELEQMKRTGRLDSLKGTWKPGDPNKPHFFWDSDIAKWIEAVAYSLAVEDNPDLEAQADEMALRIKALQQSDGYFNTYYTLVEPGKRFTYVKRMHELYCLGHLIEAAVAYFEATGKRTLLDVAGRYVDLVSRLFGPRSEGKMPGYDGHEEIELALVKLYRVTGDPRHLDLCRFFVHQRGRLPHFYEEECERRGEAVEDRKYRNDMQGMYAYHQAHLPALEQDRAVGHAVRGTYFYCGMQDLARLDGDRQLARACRNIWDNITRTQLYITGGIGPNPVGERFTYDYQLPNAMSYNETCSSIGLFLFAARMLCAKPAGEYADVMERCLYNTIIGGVSLSGDRFYYSNPLSVLPSDYENLNEPRPQVSMLRQEWFDVACCPPNLARLVMSLSSYIFLIGEKGVWVNLFMESSTQWACAGTGASMEMRTDYPIGGSVRFKLKVSKPSEFFVALRIPAWSANTYRLDWAEGAGKFEQGLEDGYLYIRGLWAGETSFTLHLDLRPRVTHANPLVAEDCGKLALERGPLVYCLEEIDNGPRLHDLRVLPSSIREEGFNPGLLGGVVPLHGLARRRKLPEGNKNPLYYEGTPEFEEVKVKAVPFYARYNRGGGEMIVWILNQER